MKCQRPYYGWAVLLAVWMAYFLCVTPAIYGSNILMTGMMQEGLSETAYSQASSAKYLGTAVASMLAAPVIRKIGRKAALMVGAAGVMAALVINGIVLLPDVLFVLNYFMIGCFAVLAVIVTGPSLINAWFYRNCALPMSLFISAGSVGGFLMPLLAEFCMERWGWRTCWLIYAALAGASIVIEAFLVVEEPGRIGEIKDGRLWVSRHPEPAPPPAMAEEEQSGTRSKRLPFCLMCGQTFLMRLAYAGIASYIALAALSKGMSASQAAMSLALCNGVSLVGRLAAGEFDRDRLPPFVVSAAGFLPALAGFGLLSLCEGTWAVYLGTSLAGIGLGFGFSHFSILTIKCFGKDNYTFLFGIFNLMAGAGSSAGPLLMSCLIARDSTYVLAFAVLAVANVLCVVIAMLLHIFAKRRGTKYFD